MKEIPQKLYHATIKQLLPSIKKYGLGGKIIHRFWDYEGSEYENVKGVFLAEDEYDAFAYVESSDYVYDIYENFDSDTDIRVFEVDTSILNKSCLEIDSNQDANCGTWFYRGIIPFEYLKRVKI